MDTLKKFPRGFTSWHETHFEVVAEIARIRSLEEEEAPLNNKVAAREEAQGFGGLYELAEELTDKFEQENKDKTWDGDYFDFIEEFLEKELK